LTQASLSRRLLIAWIAVVLAENVAEVAATIDAEGEAA
jgi:hypothetical protein